MSYDFFQRFYKKDLVQKKFQAVCQIVISIDKVFMCKKVKLFLAFYLAFAWQYAVWPWSSFLLCPHTHTGGLIRGLTILYNQCECVCMIQITLPIRYDSLKLNAIIMCVIFLFLYFVFVCNSAYLIFSQPGENSISCQNSLFFF